MALCELCVLSVLFTAPAPAVPVLDVAAQFALQNPHASKAARGASRSPAGGTPEPATLLLVAGSVLGYGALRGRRNRAAAVVKAGV